MHTMTTPDGKSDSIVNRLDQRAKYVSDPDIIEKEWRKNLTHQEALKNGSRDCLFQSVYPIYIGRKGCASSRRFLDNR